MILDVGLPGMDGFHVLKEVRERGQRLPVIVLTARDEVEDKVAGLEGGADDYVTKPFRFEELLARVRARLRDEGRPEATKLEAAGICSTSAPVAPTSAAKRSRSPRASSYCS